MVREDNRDKIPKWLRELTQTEEVWTSLIQTLTGHSDSVSCIAFSPDGKQIASGLDDGTITLWDAGVRFVVFPSNRKQILSRFSRLVRGIFGTGPKQPTTQEEIKIDEFDKLLQTSEEFEVGGLVHSLRFSADGQ